MQRYTREALEDLVSVFVARVPNLSGESGHGQTQTQTQTRAPASTEDIWKRLEHIHRSFSAREILAALGHVAQEHTQELERETETLDLRKDAERLK
jgi:hypothetical protein